jgi:hypothetical protein
MLTTLATENGFVTGSIVGSSKQLVKTKLNIRNAKLKIPALSFNRILYLIKFSLKIFIFR